MAQRKTKIGIIGGSGLDDPRHQLLDRCSQVQREDARNDFGLPSSDLYEGSLAGVEIVVLSRHGTGHRTYPSAVNYRANIEALRIAGCTHVLASTACGSLTETINRGWLVVPDGFLDRTICRKGTFFDGTSSHYAGVCHVPMEPAFHPRTSEVLFQAAKKHGNEVIKGGTVVTIEGPRFSSKAESNAMRTWGGHLVNMTTCPEVCLAKEAGLLYAAVAMATDYDCWRDREGNVHAADVLAVFKQNAGKVRDVLVTAVKMIADENWDNDIEELQNLVRSSNVSCNESS
ncbi:hypothetical protein KM043_000493 [Ampulex compressa]|nr:hypothetical protein KM043_000493 [Ampulex compressa]